MDFEAMILNRQVNSDLAESGGVNFEDVTEEWEKAGGEECASCGFTCGQHSIGCKAGG